MLSMNASSNGMVSHGKSMRARMAQDDILPLIGIYDVFSAALAARKFEAIFCSGYGFAASHYGLPDEGFIAWTDMVSYVERIRAVLPETHIVVDIDDGHGDANIAANFARRLERVGASAVILEDQRRPKRCGHLPGKEILPLEEYLPRLEAVLQVRDELFVVARTDTTDIEEGILRAETFARAGADGVLVEGITDLSQISRIREAVGDEIVITVNLIAGGKTPPVTLQELKRLGADLVNYSTPCLFAAQSAIEVALDDLLDQDGELRVVEGGIDLTTNNDVLKEMLEGALGQAAQNYCGLTD
jgi:2-methylisocitrate lyase-like PEP mutase family enzyme